MSKLFRLACLLIVLAFALPLHAQDNVPVSIKEKMQQAMTLGASSQGYEFYVAIPPNESSTYSFNPELLAIYVTSTKPTDVTVEYGSSRQLIKKKRINAPFSTVSFTNYAGELSFKTYEVRIPEMVRDQGIRITSKDNPISVYVMNSKNTTSDGYMAIPTSSWGTDYIHCAYYDNNEGTDAAQGIQYFGAGFIICGGHDNTTVNITLKGKGAGFSTTTSGREIGDNWSINLGAGQTYLVQGKANTDGMFDLTGTSIKSDKPIGLISYNQRADLPALIGSSRDHLCEMIPPVQAWGKKYASIEYKRNDKGDLFRVVASQNNTKYKMTWYDMKNDEVIGRREGTLKKAGDFAEVSEILSNPGGQASIRGVSIFEADKPILVMQYSYSSSWDGANNFDPFMIVVSAVEQFTKATVFVTPDREFTDNKFNIIAIGDTTDPVRHTELLQSVKLDGKPMWVLDPAFIQNRIPGTNLFWGRVMNLEVGPHYIVGNTPFGGYVYGFTSVDSYGWPAAMSVNKLDELDTLAPEYTFNGICGDYTVNYTEIRNGKDGDDPKQVDMGVSEQPTLLEGSYNFLEPIFDPPFISYPPNYRSGFKLMVDDLRKDANAVFAITDRAGNVSIDSIFYSADLVEMTPNPLDFGNVRINQLKDLEAFLNNAGKSKVNIKSIKLKYGTNFSILNPDPVSIDVAGAHKLDVRYNPKATTTNNTKDVDSIIVETDCLTFTFPIFGVPVFAAIEVADWDAGTVVVGDKVCQTAGIQIKNIGTEDLTITGFDWATIDDAFTCSNPTDPAFPFVIKAKAPAVNLRMVCFEPKVEKGQFTAVMKFLSNAETGDDEAVLIGKSVQPGPQITSYDWSERRVVEETADFGYDYFVTVSNSGTSPLRLTGVEFENSLQSTNDKSYTITSLNPPMSSGYIDVYPQTDTDPSHVTAVKVNIRFKPLSEDNEKSVKILPIFAPKDNVKRGDVYGVLAGIGILPKIDPQGYTFTNPIEVGKSSADLATPEIGTVTIASTSTTADLYIKDVIVTGNVTDFIFIDALPKDITIPRGETRTYKVEFTPKATGNRSVQLEIISDGFKAPDSIKSSFVTVNAVGYDQGLEVTNINFGHNTRCDEPLQYFEIQNVGTTSAITIKSITVEAPNNDIFEIVNFVQDEQVNATESKQVQVRFKPSARTGEISDNGANVKANVIVETNIGTKVAIVEGRSVMSMINLSQPKLGTNSKLTAGMTTTSQYSEFPVNLKLAKDATHNGEFVDANITEFTVNIEYNPQWLKFNGSVTNGDIINGWNLTAKETIHSETSATLTVTGKGTNPITKDGKLFNPNFLILLTDAKSLTPTFGAISFSGRDVCVESTNTPGSIDIELCVQDLRNVLVNKNNYSLAPINPNPVSSGAVKVNYGIGLDNSVTKIEIVNSMGEVVRTIQDGTANAGNFEVVIPVSDLNSGVYFINMTSGPFTAKEKLVITK